MYSNNSLRSCFIYVKFWLFICDFYFCKVPIVLRKVYNHISYTSSIEPNVKDTWAVFQIIPHYFDNQPTIDDIVSYLKKELECKDMILTESNLYYFKKRNYILLGNVKPKLSKDYKHSFNDVSSVFFSINKPWYHPEIEIIQKITELESKK